MSAKQKTYIAIDLKSFYASVEAAERGYDPLDVNLVVADESRTDKTICLAVSPALKAHGISGRARLFEAKEGIRAVNAERLKKAPGGKFSGSSVFASELAADPSLKLDMVVAVLLDEKLLEGLRRGDGGLGDDLGHRRHGGSRVGPGGRSPLGAGVGAAGHGQKEEQPSHNDCDTSLHGADLLSLILLNT